MAKARGPSEDTRAAVLARARGRCERCDGIAEWSWSVHHRQPRGMGGSRVPYVNLPGNLMLLCGSGTTGCHGRVESNRAWAVQHGYLVPRPGIPSTTPVWYRGASWKLLTDDGDIIDWVEPPDEP